MQEKQQYSYFPYILYFQFALIDDQPNAFFFSSIYVGSFNYVSLNYASLK